MVSFVDCSFADGSCVGVLFRRCQLLGARLSIVAPATSALRRILDVTDLTTALPAHMSLRRARLAMSSDSHASTGRLRAMEGGEVKTERGIKPRNFASRQSVVRSTENSHICYG